MKTGYIVFVLHTHIPYVIGQGSWPHGEDWLYEAVAECYLPLLDSLFSLRENGIDFQLNLSITPILAEQLAHPAFPTNFQSYLQRKIEGSTGDKRYFTSTGQTALADTATWWRDFYQGVLSTFSQRFHYELLRWLKELHESGQVELLTSPATHAYLPLLSTDGAVRAQLKSGVSCFEKFFGSQPRGLWLPECAYRPREMWTNPLLNGESQKRAGIEELVAEAGLEYFILDTHMLTGKEAIGTFREKFQTLKKIMGRGEQEQTATLEEEPEEHNSPLEPYRVLTPGREAKPQITALIRDMLTGLQVWSGDLNYPRDGWYMDFSKKHFPGGNRYWRITDTNLDMVHKEPYNLHRALGKAEEHAVHFISLCREIAGRYHRQSGRPAIIVAPFDTELFGHWWREGVDWLSHVLRLAHQDEEFSTIRLGEFCDRHPARKGFFFKAGSWGEEGGDWTWMNERTTWIWKLIYQAEGKMTELVKRGEKHSPPQLDNILRLCAQELMLLEASDWPYLVTTLEASDYAALRVSNHYEDFGRLSRIAADLMDKGKLAEHDRAFIEHLSKESDFLGQINPNWYLENPSSDE